MAFIGNTPTTQAFTPAVDYFSGNASTTAFTLSRPVASVAQVQVVVNNVAQNPSSAYTISSNTITFTSAPSSGTNNIYVYYTSPITDVIAPGQGTVNTTALGNITNIASGNSSLTLQTGSGNTTAVTVDTSQNVGIGTTTPNANTGTALVLYSTNTPRFRLTNNTTGQAAGDGSEVSLFSTGELIIENREAQPTIFYNNGAERMRIDSSGRVTTPYQTGFNMTANNTAFTGSTLPYAGTVFNTGSAYNTSTYVFTAPVTGVYIFSWQFFSPPSTPASVDFQKNGSAIGRFGTESGSLNNYAGWSGSIIINMSATDTAQMVRFTGTVHLNPTYSYFAGFLLG